MKKFFRPAALTATVILFLNSSLFPQAPKMFNYQAVVRDISNQPITNTDVSVLFNITQGSAFGTEVYSETHAPQTNDYGMINLVIGSGSTTDDISAIDWSAGPYVLKITIDGNMIDTVHLQSVPYSLFADKAGNAFSGVYDDLTGKPDLSPYLDSRWTSATDDIYFNTGNVGVGTDTPRSTLSVSGASVNDTAIFEVINNSGQRVFAVYNDGVRIIIDETAKGPKGGFAIGGFDEVKGTVQDYLTVHADSTRVYVKQAVKGPKGGFAIGGFDGAKKGVLFNFVDLTPENYLIGHESGQNITTGLYNSFFGYQAGLSNTTGNNNIFMGYQAGYSNLTGNNNVFLGYGAGYSNIGGDAQAGTNNVFIGNGSGAANTLGQDNAFVGYLSGAFNTTGDYNVFMGHAAGKSNTSGYNNVYIGYDTGLRDTTGKSNVYIGYYAAKDAIQGTIPNLWNVAIGAYAGYNLNGTIATTLLGYDAGRFTTTGSGNTFLGTASGKENITGHHNTFVGAQTGRDGTATTNNTFIGESAGMNINGNYNTLIGSRSAIFMTSGYGNTFIGKNTGENRTTGSYNILIGLNAGLNDGSGNNNVIIGANSAQMIFGANNTFLGHETGHETTGGGNLFLGYQAGYFETGSNKLYIENSDSDPATALIYGEFDTDILRINASVGIGGDYSVGDMLNVYGNIRVTGGSFIDDGTPLSDFVFDSSYQIASIETHAEFMWKNKHLPALKGADEIDAAGGYDIIERREQILEELEVAHIYIEQLNNRIKELEAENRSMKTTQELILLKIEELSENK